MFTIVYPYDVTIPAGTSKNAPLVTLTQFEPNVVERIDWLFPDGCNGLVGIRIGAQGVSVIPWNVNAWLIRSGDSGGYDVEDMHTTGDWSVIGYNTGAYPHTVHVTFRVHRIPPKPVPLDMTLASSVIGVMGES